MKPTVGTNRADSGNLFSSVKSHKLVVNEVHNAKEHPKPKVHPMLPQPPFLWCIVAPRKSGKTNLLVDSLIDKEKYCGVFDDIYVWSQTFYLDPKWRRLDIKEDRVFTKWNAQECKDIAESIAAEVDADPRKHFLFIWDDMIDAKVMKTSQLGIMESLAVRGRHSNISVVISSQQFKSLSTPIRNNTTNLIIFRIRNQDELRKIMVENQESLTSDEFMQIYNYATDQPYSFLHINNQEAMPKLRFRAGWSELIILK